MLFWLPVACAPVNTPTPVPSTILTPVPEPEPVPESTPAPEPPSTPAPTPITVSAPESIPAPTSPGTTPILESEIPIVDAHSQCCPENLEKVIPLMDQGGVACTILSSGVTSTRGIVTPEELVSLASSHPGRIIPAVRTKVRPYENYYELLEKQMNMDGFDAMAEFLMYHSQKGDRAPEIVAYPDDEGMQTALNYSLDKEWPFVVHIEFAATSCPSDEFMAGLKALLVEYPEHPFVLIHMGQLEHAAVRQLIEAYDNIYFITSSSTPVYATNPFNDLWTNMFDGDHLSAEWKQLIIDHPDRFVMGFDMVWAEQWGEFYLGQVKLWREAIKELPIEVAHALAHGNAERLWHLPPTPPITPPLPLEVPATTEATPLSAVTGLVAINAYDGRVNLFWDKSNAEDFGHYNIYVSKSEITDVTGMTPINQIRDMATNNYQVTGLETETKYYFSVTAVDKSGAEKSPVTWVSAIPTLMTRGTIDPDIYVDVYEPDRVWAGTTLLADNHNLEKPRIMEVNMLGEIIWEYQVPRNLRQYTNPGFDVELLPNNNILFVLPRNGVYEIERNGNIVWSYLDNKVSHDADRLPNGNTLVVWGGGDEPDDAHVKEIDPEGEIVWAWYAKDHFYESPYKDIDDEGWTHTNAATRLSNGNTLISPRNFNFVVEVDAQGSVIRTLGEGLLYYQHDPVILPNGNLLSGSHRPPPMLASSIISYPALEIELETGEIVWGDFVWPAELRYGARDANRLPNGHTLVQVGTRVVELTTNGEIVWQLRLKEAIEKEIQSTKQSFRSRSFYKAERISPQK